MIRKFYQEIASLLTAIENCETSQNHEWRDRHHTRLECICEKYLPSGSGIDNGTKLAESSSHPNHLVFTFGYHHHGEHGYTGWSDYKVSITPSLAHGINLTITGRNTNGVKEYLTDTFMEAMRKEIDTQVEYKDI